MVYIFFILYIYLSAFLFLSDKKKSDIKLTQKTNNQLFLGGVFIFAWLIMGLRSISVGVDTHNYNDIFHYYSKLTFQQTWEYLDVEPGFAFLNSLGGRFGWNYLIFQLFFTGLFCLLSFNFVYQSNKFLRQDRIFLLTILFFTYIWFLSFNIARQVFAVLLTANSWVYLVNRKYYISLIFFLFAILFHYSSAIFIIVIILWSLKKNQWFNWLSIFLLCFLFLFFSIILEKFSSIGFYDKYLNNGFNEFQEANLSKITWIIVGIQGIWILFNKKRFNSNESFIAVSSCVYVILNFLSDKLNYIERVALYFLPFVIILFPIIANGIKTKSIRIIYLTGVITLFTIWYIKSSKAEQLIYSFNELL